MKTTKKYQMNSAPLHIRADWSQASCPIEYSTDGGETWGVSVFQVADAQHSPAQAAQKVREWLRGDRG